MGEESNGVSSETMIDEGGREQRAGFSINVNNFTAESLIPSTYDGGGRTYRIDY